MRTRNFKLSWLKGMTGGIIMSLVISFAMTGKAFCLPVYEAALGGTSVLSVETSKGRLIRLPSPAKTVFIADPEVADVYVKSPTLVYITAKKAGTTTLFAVDAREKVLASLDVAVTPDIPVLRQEISSLYPGIPVSVDAIGSNIVLRGRVDDASQAADIKRLASRMAGGDDYVVNQISVTEPQQINLRVRVAEMSRTLQKQLGFNWSASGAVKTATLGITTTNPFVKNVVAQAVNLALPIGNLNLNGILDLLDEEGLVKILAEPNLTSMSGETASFLAGGEFPILVPGSNGQVTVTFKKFGVSLAFTPTIVGKSRINLHVRPEVSELSTVNSVKISSFEIPSLTTRRAETTVELGSGQSFAIAGLIQNDSTHDVSKVPGLGDIPILGALFRSDNFKKNESELVIIVTPYVVKPTSERMALPTDGFTPPSDVDRWRKGGTFRAPGEEKNEEVSSAGGRIAGPGGLRIGR